MSMVVQTPTTDTSTGGHATTVPTRDGTLIELDTDIQLTHLPVESSSRSSQECHPTEPSSGTNTSVVTSIDSELETTTPRTTSNGSPSMTELSQLEPGQRETTLLPTKLDNHSISEELPPLDHGEMRTTKKQNGLEVNSEISRTMVRSALTFTVDQTPITDTLPTGTATMVLTKPGTSTKRASHTQDNHSRMELDSRSDPR